MTNFGSFPIIYNFHTVNNHKQNPSNQVENLMSTTYPRLEIKSALEHFSSQGDCLKMTTGSGELDSLIDGIQEGLFYLFYGDAFPLDALSHSLLVNCVVSTKEHGFESMAVCFNNTDYYGQIVPFFRPSKRLWLNTNISRL